MMTTVISYQDLPNSFEIFSAVIIRMIQTQNFVTEFAILGNFSFTLILELNFYDVHAKI